MNRRKLVMAGCLSLTIAVSNLNVYAAEKATDTFQRHSMEVLEDRILFHDKHIEIDDPHVISAQIGQNDNGQYILRMESEEPGRTELHLIAGDGSDDYLLVEVSDDGEIEIETYVPWNGWNYLGDKLSYKANGTELTGWQKPQNTRWYHFDENGDADTGWYQDKEDNGNWYYLSSSISDYGAMKTGWIVDESGWKTYYLDSNGRMLSSQWVNADGDNAVGKLSGPYYLQSDGAVQVNGWAESPMPGVYWFLRAGDGWFNQWDEACWSSALL